MWYTPLDAVQVPLVDRIDADITRSTLGMGLAAFPDAGGLGASFLEVMAHAAIGL